MADTQIVVEASELFRVISTMQKTIYAKYEELYELYFKKVQKPLPCFHPRCTSEEYLDICDCCHRWFCKDHGMRCFGVYPSSFLCEECSDKNHHYHFLHDPQALNLSHFLQIQQLIEEVDRWSKAVDDVGPGLENLDVGLDWDAEYAEKLLESKGIKFHISKLRCLQ